MDGLLNLDDFAEQTGIELPEGPYETVAGYMLAVLGQLPTGHEAVEVGRAPLTVLAMDGRRIARVRVDPAEPDGEASAQGGCARRPGRGHFRVSRPRQRPAAPRPPPQRLGLWSPPGRVRPPEGSSSPANPTSLIHPGNLSRPVTQVVIDRFVASNGTNRFIAPRRGRGAHVVRHAATRPLDWRFSRGRRWRAARSGL